MTSNYVEIKVRASDTAKPDLTDLKARLDELGAKVESARVDVDDKDAAAKLLDLNAKLAAIGKKVERPRIDVAGAARAEAQIAAVDAEISKLDKKAQSQGKGGLLGKILTGGPSLPGGVPLLGGMSPAALGAIAAAAQAALVEVTGLVSGFAAAGAGAGAFGALAMPAFKSISGSLTQVNADQQTYDRALTKTAKNTALKHLQQDYAALDPAQRGAVKGIQGLSDSYHKMAKAFEPTAFKVFNDGLKIANNLLPALSPLATSFANALDGLLKKVGKFTASKGFKDWLKQFEKLSGPSVTAIGTGIGKVAVAIGKLLTIMSKKDVVNSINIAFSVLAGTITGIGIAVRFIMRQWDLLTTAFDAGRKAAKTVAHDIAHYFDDVRHDAATLAHDIAHYFDDIKSFARRLVSDVGGILNWFGSLPHKFASWFDQVRHSISSKFDDAVSFVKGIPGRILSALGNVGSLLWNAGKNIIQGLINGIGSMIGSVGSAIGSIAGEITSHLPFSPAKKGPLSGAGSPDRAGARIGQMLAQGMTGSTSAVSAAAAHMAGAAAIGGAGRGGGAGGPTVIHLDIASGGMSQFEQAFLTWFRQQIRIKGGNVQLVLGH